MTDFHSVLSRAIEALPEKTGEARRAVYDRARGALVRQLQSIDPPLSPAEITSQRLSLEESIRKVEADFADQAFTFVGEGDHGGGGAGAFGVFNNASIAAVHHGYTRVGGS